MKQQNIIDKIVNQYHPKDRTIKELKDELKKAISDEIDFIHGFFRKNGNFRSSEEYVKIKLDLLKERLVGGEE